MQGAQTGTTKKEKPARGSQLLWYTADLYTRKPLLSCSCSRRGTRPTRWPSLQHTGSRSGQGKGNAVQARVSEQIRVAGS